jgi:hypothetical protein
MTMDTPMLYREGVGLSERQVEVAALVVEEFLAAGFSPAVAAAAVVNAFAESSLDPTAVSSSKKFVGLFQVSSDILPEGRTDARKNTRAIIEECRRAPDFMDLAETSADIYDLSEAFCMFVERPSKKKTKCPARGALADRLYPTSFWQNAPEALIPRAPERLAPRRLTEEQQKWVLWGLAALSVVGGFWHLRQVKARLALEDARD